MLYSVNSLPTHLVVGVGKSATSWIWKQLEDCPEISTAANKEVHFFNKNFQKGLNWYRSQFLPNKIVVDNTPDYFSLGDAYKIKKTLPYAKTLVCLRNPIDRAFSQFKYHRFIRIIDLKKSFIDIWKSDVHRIKSLGIYPDVLKEYILFFENNFSTLFYDDLKNDPESFILNLYDFLGVENHKSKYFDDKWMPRIADDKKKLEEYEKINKNIQLTKNDKNIMIDFYKNHINETSKIIGRDLSSWMN